LIIYIASAVVISFIFQKGIIENEDFNIYDFCMNLCTEIVGFIIAFLSLTLLSEKKRTTLRLGEKE